MSRDPDEFPPRPRCGSPPDEGAEHHDAAVNGAGDGSGLVTLRIGQNPVDLVPQEIGHADPEHPFHGDHVGEGHEEKAALGFLEKGGLKHGGGREDHEEAERTHQQAIAAQPRYAYAHIAYGNFLFNLGRAADAIGSYERATVLAPDNPNAFSNLGTAYMFTGDFERAGRALERSIAVEPRRASYSGLGSVQYYLGRYREADTLFRKAIELAPADHRLWGNLGDALRFDARPEEAREAYRRALELADGELAVNPKHAVNQAQAAYYAIQLGEAERARRGIALALPEGDGSNYVHYYVALAELGLGDKARALSHLERARKLGYPEVLLKAAPELGEMRRIVDQQ